MSALSREVRVRRTINVVSEEAMMQDSLYLRMRVPSPDTLATKIGEINQVVAERVAYEAKQVRLVDGVRMVAQSNDIKSVIAFHNNDAFARLAIALRLDVRTFLFPQSKQGGKSSTESSSMKAYAKAIQIAETIYTGSSKLEGVVKIWSVCAYKASVIGNEVLDREFTENFLNSREFYSIHSGSSDLMEAIDEVRAKHMSGGAPTQTSQMIRMLVALKSATDVQRGKSKDVKIDPQGRVMVALMRRLGQITMTPKDDAKRLTEVPVSVEEVSEETTSPVMDDASLVLYGLDPNAFSVHADLTLVDADSTSDEVERDVYAWFDPEEDMSSLVDDSETLENDVFGPLLNV